MEQTQKMHPIHFVGLFDHVKKQYIYKKRIIPNRVTPENRDSVIEMVINRACNAFGLTDNDMLGKSRALKFVTPRQIAMYDLRGRGLTWKEIGAAFKRDHSTAIYSCNTYEALYNKDKEFTRLVRLYKEF